MPVGGALQQMQIGGQREERRKQMRTPSTHKYRARSWRGDATPKGGEREEEVE